MKETLMPEKEYINMSENVLKAKETNFANNTPLEKFLIREIDSLNYEVRNHVNEVAKLSFELEKEKEKTDFITKISLAFVGTKS